MKLSEEQGHRTDNILYRPLVGLSSQQIWWRLPEQSEVIEHLLFK